MPLLHRKKGLAAKIESTYGTDPTIAPATDSIQTYQLEINPLEGDFVNRDIDRAQLGAEGDVLVSKRTAINFGIEAQSSGTLGTAPAWGKLLRGCGFAETINAGVSVVYAPVSSAFSSLWMEGNIDGNKHVAKGARGNFSLQWAAKGIPRFNFGFMGLYVAPVSAALPTYTLTPWKIPVPVGKANTTTASLHGTALNLSDFSLDVQNAIEHRDIVNVEEVLIVDREVRGSMTFEAPLISTKDWYASILARTRGALQIVHGVGAGYILQIDAPVVEISNPRYSEQQGVAMMTVDIILVPNSTAGNDELTITAK